jgi:hypothetical protein
MASSYTDTYAELDEIDVDETDLEEVEVDGDVDAWMHEMLSGPFKGYDY